MRALASWKRSECVCASGLWLFDGDDLVRGNVREFLNLATGPGDHDFFDRLIQSEAEVNPRIAGAGIANGGCCFVPLHAAVGSSDADLCTEAHAVAARAYEADKNPVLASGADVAEELDGLIEAGDDDIDAAGIEDIAEGCAAVRCRDLKRRSGAGTDILEFGVAEIAEDAVGLGVGLRGDSLLDVVHHVGASDEKVFPSVVVEIVDAVAPASHAIGEVAEATGDSGICEDVAALRGVKGKVFVLDGSVPDVGAAVVVDVAEISTHAGERVAIERIGDACRYGNLFELLSANVVEEEVGHGVVCNESVEKTVAVDVGEGDGHAFSKKGINTGFVRHVRKSAVAVVAIESVVERRVLVGMTVAAHTFFERAIGVLVHFPMAVVDDKEIEETIVVVVEPARAYRPHLLAMGLRTSNARLRGDVSECPIAVVVKELIAGHVGNENVGATIVVVVTNGDAHAIACSGDAGFFRDVGEGAVVVVAVKTVPIVGRGFFERRNFGAVDAINVEESVVVVVEQRNAGNHRFGLVFVGCGAIARDEMEASLLGDLFKADRWRWHRSRASLRGKRPEAAWNKRRGRECSKGLEKLTAPGARDVIADHARLQGCREANRSSERRLWRRRRLLRRQSFTTVIDRRVEKRRDR